MLDRRRTPVRDGSPLLAADLEAFLRTRGLWDLERDGSPLLASNPAAGKIVTVHSMALAELGLAGSSIRERMA